MRPARKIHGSKGWRNIWQSPTRSFTARLGVRIARNRKKLFGSSVKRIPYVECSPGGPQAPQAAVCKEKDIQELSDLDH